MLNMDFTVDLSVWQDGFVYQTEPAQAFNNEKPQPVNRPSFAQQLQAVSSVEPEKSAVRQIAPASPAALNAREQKTPEMPAALAEVIDLTPFVVSADTAGKPGERLNSQIDHTVFSKNPNRLLGKNSPYNMSEEKAKARESGLQASKTLKAPENAKVFPMNSAARFRNNETKFGVAQPLTVNAAEQAKQLRIDEMKQQAKAKTVAETNTSLAQKPSIDPEAVRAQVSSEGFGYKRPNLPNASSEKVSPAASWFPEAMTRQLDAYEAARKVAQHGATGATQKSVTDLAI